jgi:hypothetical protein
MATRICIECEASFKSSRYDACFCGAACRNAFNNRRRDRGAMLYDLVMIEATSPGEAERHGFAEKREQLVAEWIQEDQGAGRKRTHKPLFDVIASLSSRR